MENILDYNYSKPFEGKLVGRTISLQTEILFLEKLKGINIFF